MDAVVVTKNVEAVAIVDTARVNATKEAVEATIKVDAHVEEVDVVTAKEAPADTVEEADVDIAVEAVTVVEVEEEVVSWNTRF